MTSRTRAPTQEARLPRPDERGPSDYAAAYWGLGTRPIGPPIVTEEGLRVAPNGNGNWTLSWPRGFKRAEAAWPAEGAVLRQRGGTWSALVEGVFIRGPRSRVEARLRVLTT